MKQSRKWLALVLVCSQFLTTFPASAAVVTNTEESEEQAQMTPEDQETQPEERPEDLPLEEVDPPIEEEPVLPEVPEEIPEEPTPAPKPEDPAPVDPPKEEVKPAPTPQPDQSTNQEATPESRQPAPVENKRPTLPELTESTQAEANQSTTIAITPVKETSNFIKEIGEEARKIGLEEDLYGSVMIAQAILESASGQSRLSQAPYHNLFGIKGTYEGKGVTFKTQEDDGSGNLYTIDAMFRQSTLR